MDAVGNESAPQAALDDVRSNGKGDLLGKVCMVAMVSRYYVKSFGIESAVRPFVRNLRIVLRIVPRRTRVGGRRRGEEGIGEKLTIKQAA